MDPISIAVTVLAIYGMLQRSPQWAGEVAEEWRAAKRGEESPAAAARRQRLIDHGIDPATGGPMRQYLGNRWRDFWLDEDIKATRRRADRLDKEAAGEALSWRERVASRIDDEVTRRAEQWRNRPPADVVPPVTVTGGSTPNPGGDGAETTPPAGPPTAAPDSASTGSDSAGGGPDNTDDRWTSSTVHDDDFYTRGGARRTQDMPTDPNAATPRDPIRVDATVGDPIRPTQTQPTAAPAAITAGGNMSNAVAQQAVTGVVSGAAEARAIEAALNAATEEYVTRLNRLRGRIAQLGEQTVGTVQMSGRSQVVANIAAAAEAAAAAQANARSCTTEVVPLLGQVARAFERINS